MWKETFIRISYIVAAILLVSMGAYWSYLDEISPEEYQEVKVLTNEDGEIYLETRRMLKDNKITRSVFTTENKMVMQ